MFEADGAPAFADGLVERVAPPGRAELGGVALAEAADRVRRELRLAHRRQVERAQLAGRALRLGIEGADRFQRIAEEIEAERGGEGGGVEIDDAAALRVIADVAHEARAREAVRLQPSGE